MSRSVTREFDAPAVEPALSALEEGRRPDDRTLRAAIRELRSVLKFVQRHGVEGSNQGIILWLEEHIEVLSWALSQPVEAPIHLCERCGERPRHFGDLCKSCAEETGQRPRGKV